MAKIKNPKNVWLFCRVLEALVLIVAGILAIIYYNNQSLHNVIFYLAGAFLILDALIRVTRYFIDPVKLMLKGKGLLVAALEMAIGIVICIKPDFLPNLVEQIFSLFLAVFLFALAAILIIQAVIKILAKSKNISLIVIEFIVAAVLITCGVLVIYYNAAGTIINALFIIIGVVLVLLGVIVLINGFKPLDKEFEKLAD